MCDVARVDGFYFGGTHVLGVIPGILKMFKTEAEVG